MCAAYPFQIKPVVLTPLPLIFSVTLRLLTHYADSVVYLLTHLVQFPEKQLIAYFSLVYEVLMLWQYQKFKLQFNSSVENNTRYLFRYHGKKKKQISKYWYFWQPYKVHTQISTAGD